MAGRIDQMPGPAGPRGVAGRRAEAAAASHLVAGGWRVLARNVRVDRDEIDLVAVEPGPPETLVFVEVRSHSGRGFGDPRESVDARKVSRLYRAAAALRRRSDRPLGLSLATPWRVDLLVLAGNGGTRWRVTAHIHGLEPP